MLKQVRIVLVAVVGLSMVFAGSDKAPNLLNIDGVDQPQQQPPPPDTPITLRACCGTTCVDFTNLQDMVGLQCCGTAPVNYFERICCSGKSFERRSGSKYYDRCCNDKPYSFDETCCKGTVHQSTAQACCGSLPFNVYDRSQLCCNEKLFSVTNSTVTPACCGDSMFDAWGGSQFCCGGRLYNRQQVNSCCVKYRALETDPIVAEGYRTDTQQCCDGVFNLTQMDACCYVFDYTAASSWKPPRPTAYNSKTHCCDISGVKQRDAQGNCV